MHEIEIYSTWRCPQCLKAKNLLEMKDLPYREIDVSKGGAPLAEMRSRSGSESVPQIFIDGASIGGWDDLVKLKASGELDRLRGSSK